MQSFWVALNAIAPIFLLMSLGFLLRRRQILDSDLLQSINRLTFQVFLPCLLFDNLYQTDLTTAFRPDTILFAVGSAAVVIALTWVLVPRFVTDGKRSSVLIQGIFRSNYVVFGVSIITNMYGAENTALAALLSAILVPIYNLCSVIVLACFNSKEKLAWHALVFAILKNPLILATLAGIAVSFLDLSYPTFLVSTLDSVAGLATPLAFLVLGADFDFSLLKSNLRTALIAVALKLLGSAVVFVPLAIALGYREVELMSLILAFASPVAVSSYIMAARAGADHHLAGQLVVLSSAGCIATLFSMIYLLQSLGLL